MAGLVYLFVFFIYFLIIVFFVRVAAMWARDYKRSVGLWGSVTVLLLLSPVFWDLIPIYAMHHYQCSTNSGLTIFKTLEEWKKENPGVAETLIATDGDSTVEGDTRRYRLNQRFVREDAKSQHWYTLYKKHDQIIDIKTGEVLAAHINFYNNLNNALAGGNNVTLRDYKVWMWIASCGDEVDFELRKLNDIGRTTKNIGSNK